MCQNSDYEVLAEEYMFNSSKVEEAISSLNTQNWADNEINLERGAQANEFAVPYGHFVDGAPWKGKGPGTSDSARTFFTLGKQ